MAKTRNQFLQRRHPFRGLLVRMDPIFDLRQTARNGAALVAHSTLQALPGFGQAARGHIALQHHGDPVWFRHLCLRPLPDEQRVALPATGQGSPGTARGVGADKL